MKEIGHRKEIDIDSMVLAAKKKERESEEEERVCV